MDTANYNAHDGPKEFVPPHVPECDCITIGERIDELVRAGKKEQARALLEAEIRRGRESGPPEPWSDQDMAAIRAELYRRHEARMARRNIEG